MQSGRAIPVPCEITKPYWEAAKRHVLVMQKCSNCGYYNYPPKPICERCNSERVSFEPVSGLGKIYSYTIMNVSRVPSFEIPYMNIVVELEEQAGLLIITNLLDSDPQKVKLGSPVEVVFEEISDNVSLPQFKLLK